VPPLRERPGDVALLAGFFLDLYRRRLGLGPVRLTEAARQALTRADWPGNVRELDHLLGRAVLRAAASSAGGAPIVIGSELLQLDGVALRAARSPDETLAASPPSVMVSVGGMTLRDAVEETKRTLVRHALEQNGGSWAAAARTLGMARSNLHHMAERLGLRT
jgi:anaerobic nitric oxide reductase transcription regulator